jgi:hypothetical protein
MDSYEKARFYVITGLTIFTVLLAIGLIILFYLRYLNVIIGVDTTGLLGKPAVFINNMSVSAIKDVSVEMDDKYTAHIDKIKPKQSLVIYFTSFTPLPPANYKPLKITVKSGFGVKTKSFSPVSQ